MPAPLVSIIVRSMGRECLANAVASVARQTHRPLELVVVDATGGAHPALPELPSLSNARLVNAGRRLLRPAAANVGIDHAKGEWIGFLDDDDFFEPTHVARLVARAAEADRPRLVHAQLWGLDRFHRVAIQRDTRVNPLIMYFNCQIAAMSCNTKLIEVPADVVGATYMNYQPHVRRPFGVLDWPALLRKLDRIDPGFRD